MIDLKIDGEVMPPDYHRTVISSLLQIDGTLNKVKFIYAVKELRRQHIQMMAAFGQSLARVLPPATATTPPSSTPNKEASPH